MLSIKNIFFHVRGTFEMIDSYKKWQMINLLPNNRKVNIEDVMPWCIHIQDIKMVFIVYHHFRLSKFNDYTFLNSPDNISN